MFVKEKKNNYLFISLRSTEVVALEKPDWVNFQVKFVVVYERICFS